jgi:hypothetical protein
MFSFGSSFLHMTYSEYPGPQLSTLVSTAVDYGAFAAQDRQTASESTGFSFMNCTLTGTGYNYLGRAMGPYSRIIYAYSYIDNMLAPGGWDDWDHDTSRDR